MDDVLCGVDWSGGLGVVFLKPSGDTREGFCRTEERVIVGTMANALAFDSVLLWDNSRVAEQRSGTRSSLGASGALCTVPPMSNCVCWNSKACVRVSGVLV